jgi:hypothetical protein
MSGVGLVEHGDAGLEHRHLQDLVAFLLAAAEALVEVAAGEGFVHAQPIHPLGHEDAHLERRDVLLGASRDGLAEELGHRHALDRLGILEGEEQARLGTDVGGPRRDVLTVEEDGPRRHRVGGVSHERSGERGLPGSVGSHQRVDLAGPDGEVDATQDLLAFRGDVEVPDLEQWRHF